MATQLPEQDVDKRGVNSSLRKQVQSAKLELTDHFQNYHRMLYEKEQALISELDAILMSAHDLHEKKRELRQTRGDLEEKMKRNEFQAMKGKILEVVNAELCELELQLKVSEREVVELEWRDSELSGAIQNSCVVLKKDPTVIPNPIISPNQPTVPYSDRQVPLWSVGTIGSGDGQLDKPRSVAVDPENEDIYVADNANDRIAVFNNNGVFVRNFTVEGMKWPYGIVIDLEFCYISSSQAQGRILKANKKNGQRLSSLEPGVAMFALTLDKETGMLFACPLHTNCIWHIQPDSLNKVSELTLHTPHFIENSTKLYDIKTLKDELYILFYKSPYPLQSFSRDGNLLRTIIAQDSVSKILFFCIDLQGNFIVSDNDASKILVFSSTGDLIVKIGREDTQKSEPGELKYPSRVSLMGNNRIVVCDGKNKNKLQLF